MLTFANPRKRSLSGSPSMSKKTVKQTLWINAGLFRHVPFQSALNAIGGELEKAAWIRSNSRRRRDASCGVH